VTGQPLAAAIHSNVGLMHASMAIYNAYCDRVPMLIIGATGPVDAARRRPWIDWIHTSGDQGALIRQYSKWDDQPGSVEAALNSLARAYAITREAPSAPTYVCLDASLQEQPLTATPPIPDVGRDRSPRSHGPDATAVAAAGELLDQARRPLFLLGRMSRDQQDWDRRVALAERHGALVISDLKTGAVFPSAHPLHPNAPSLFLAEALRDALADQDQDASACLVRLPLGWAGADLEVDHPLGYLGQDGGAGIGSGPGMAVGAALALEGSGRLPVAVLGDGDFLMGGTAIWTAAHYRLPLLIVVANNSFYYNDVVHQERVAGQRGRPAGNSWIGQALTDPDPDLGAFARSLGFQAGEQVRDRSALPAALAAAVAAARSGRCALVDVRVRPDGYAAPGG